MSYRALLSISGRVPMGSAMNFADRQTRMPGSVVNCPDIKSPESTPLIFISVTPGVVVRHLKSGSWRNNLCFLFLTANLVFGNNPLWQSIFVRSIRRRQVFGSLFPGKLSKQKSGKRLSILKLKTYMRDMS